VAQDTDASRIPPNGIVVQDTVKALGDLARWHRSRFDVPVIGITGSCGKTTVKEMTKLVLGDDVVASHASYNNDIGVPLTLLQMNARTRACVVELGTNAPGEIAYLTGIARPTVGVLLNVEEAHLEGLGTVRGVMREKAALLKLLPEDGVAIVNADLAVLRPASATLTRPPTRVPSITKNRLVGLEIGLLYVPSAATCAKRSRRPWRGIRTWSNQSLPLSIPLRPSFSPQSSMLTPAHTVPSSLRIGTRKACTP